MTKLNLESDREHGCHSWKEGNVYSSFTLLMCRYLSPIKVIQQTHPCGESTVLFNVFKKISRVCHTKQVFFYHTETLFFLWYCRLWMPFICQIELIPAPNRGLYPIRRALPTPESRPWRVFIPSCPINSSAHSTHCRRFSLTA